MLRIDRVCFNVPDKGVKSLKAGFALIVCSGLVMAGATIASLFMYLDEAWRAALVIVYTVPGLGGIVPIGRAFATSKSVIDTVEPVSDISERESK